MIADSPHPWSALHEDAKAYTTLAAALLGVTATFGDRLISGDTWGQFAVVLGWIALGAAVLFSIFANAAVFSGLKKPHEASFNGASLWLNLTVYAIFAGTALLAVGAWRATIPADDPPTSWPTLAREAVADMIQVNPDTLEVEGYTSNGNEIVVSMHARSNPAETFSVLIDRNLARVSEVQRG